MVRRQPFAIIYDPQVKEHLRAIDKKHHRLIRRQIEEQLLFEPDVPTRNRKPLLREIELDADWEIRFGPNNIFRVFYRVDSQQHQVQILAIGAKQGSKLFVAGREIQL